MSSLTFKPSRAMAGWASRMLAAAGLAAMVIAVPGMGRAATLAPPYLHSYESAGMSPGAPLVDMFTIPAVASGPFRYGMGLLSYTFPNGVTVLATELTIAQAAYDPPAAG